MNAERLLNVVTVLEDVPDKQFDMSYWHRPDFTCGTVGCAFGWYIAKAHPVGLELIHGGPESFTGRMDYDAAAEHFGVTGEEARFLFSELTYDCKPSKQQVIDRIRAFVASGGRREAVKP